MVPDPLTDGPAATAEALPLRARSRWSVSSDLFVGALFLGVPLAASTAFWDQFTTVKWYLLAGLTLGWFAFELWPNRSSGWPAALRGRAACGLLFLLGALMLLGSLRRGAAWAAPVALDRTCVALLVLSAFWYFRRNGLRIVVVSLAAGAALAAVVPVGLAQVLGVQLLPALTAGDQRSAFFGNVNLAAQFVGLGMVLVLATPRPRAAARALALAREALATAALVYLYFLSCRSVLLALAVALGLLRRAGQVSGRTLARVTLAAALAVLAIVFSAPALGRRPVHPFSPEVMADKALSIRMRLEVWRSTLGLIHDRPLGVGAGNFGDAFVPYQLGLEAVSRSVQFRTPHNEYLRVFAEEGIPFGLLAAVFVVVLARRRSEGRPQSESRRSATALATAGGAFLAVEAGLQFPFATAFGALTAATLTGLLLAAREPADGGSDPGRRLARWRLVGSLVVATAALVLVRVVVSEWLFVNRRADVAAQETACALDRRNLPACVTAAWLRARAGEFRAARTELVRVLRRSPYYHPAIRLLAETAQAAGDTASACRYFFVYAELFRDRPTAHPRPDLACPGAPDLGPATSARPPYYDVFPFSETDASLP